MEFMFNDLSFAVFVMVDMYVYYYLKLVREKNKRVEKLTSVLHIITP